MSENMNMDVAQILGECLKKTANTYPDYEDRVSESISNIKSNLKDSIAINDDYGNKLLSIGNDDIVEKFSDYTFSNDTLNFPLWLALYNESWVFRRAIDKPAQDEIRCGIKLNGLVEEEKDVNRMLNLYSDDMIQLLQWGALFGGSIAVCLFDNFDDEDYTKAFNANLVSKAKVMKFYVTDRWYGCSPTYDNVVSDVKNPDFGKPKYYNITMSNGKTFKYHHDYVIRYEHRFAPKLIKQGMLQGWGYAEGSHILNELSRDEKLKTSIQSLVNKALIEVIKMSGMRGVFMGTSNENQEQLKKRLEMVNWGRNYNSLTFLDKDDDYSMNNFSGLAGLSDLLQENMWQIAAALEMQGILFGDMKQGFSTDSDALERYSETILNRCESFVRPVYEKLLKYIYCMLGIKQKVDFEFLSILKDKHDKEKVSDVITFTGLLSTLLNDGVINLSQYAKALSKYITDGIVDLNFTNEDMKKLEEKEIDEAENFDLGETDE